MFTFFAPNFTMNLTYLCYGIAQMYHYFHTNKATFIGFG